MRRRGSGRAGVFASCARPAARRHQRRVAGLTASRVAITSPRMALRDILTLPDKRLRLVSKPVGKIDEDVRRLVDDMFETMYEAPGIGLAAIQVGVPKRIITMDVAKKDEPKVPQVFINPEILWTSEERATYEEGCLSIPEYYEEVERPAQVKVAFLDRDGARREIEANGLLATCLQHEIDHLNGVLFIDHLSKLKRSRVIKKFAKAAKRADADA
jgi:peptide deformylase